MLPGTAIAAVGMESQGTGGIMETLKLSCLGGAPMCSQRRDPGLQTRRPVLLLVFSSALLCDLVRRIRW
jgi:hypothetical protein